MAPSMCPPLHSWCSAHVDHRHPLTSLQAIAQFSCADDLHARRRRISFLPGLEVAVDVADDLVKTDAQQLAICFLCLTRIACQKYDGVGGRNDPAGPVTDTWPETDIDGASRMSGSERLRTAHVDDERAVLDEVSCVVHLERKWRRHTGREATHGRAVAVDLLHAREIWWRFREIPEHGGNEVSFRPSAARVGSAGAPGRWSIAAPFRCRPRRAMPCPGWTSTSSASFSSVPKSESYSCSASPRARSAPSRSDGPRRRRRACRR